ncbi:hypothetical protein DPMN_175760 [Dreissena polymorpha]|uniref:Uncharacterized protein n=1 Tax=Dreissena polymorpha TaxID=45954 RepID=A0A9D4IJX4_DREPO|nr:hypothetical protein DPMN_175760 [Dreissena polymorpha]
MGDHWPRHITLPRKLADKMSAQASAKKRLKYKPEAMALAIAAVKNRAGVHAFLDLEFPNDHDVLLEDPRRLFNADESVFLLAVKSAATGSKNVYQIVTNTKIQITVMASFNAFGEYPPPMIILPGERIRDVGLAGWTGMRFLNISKLTIDL